MQSTCDKTTDPVWAFFVIFVPFHEKKNKKVPSLTAHPFIHDLEQEGFVSTTVT